MEMLSESPFGWAVGQIEKDGEGAVDEQIIRPRREVANGHGHGLERRLQDVDAVDLAASTMPILRSGVLINDVVKAFAPGGVSFLESLMRGSQKSGGRMTAAATTARPKGRGRPHRPGDMRPPERAARCS